MHKLFFCVYAFMLSCEPANNKKIVTVQPRQDTIRNDSMVVLQYEDSIVDTAPVINYNITPLKYREFPIRVSKGNQFTLKVLNSLQLTIAAEGMQRLRFLAMSPEKRLFATDMFDKSDNSNGKVFLFTGWNDSSKSFKNVITYKAGLRNPNQIAFYNGYVYIAETGKLSRFIYRDNENKLSSTGEVIATFPDYGLGYKYGGWHLTRSIAFNNGKLYVSIGSSCNACIEKEEYRAIILEMNPDGSEKKIFARGLRNAVGMKWIGNQLWVTGMGRDLIGPDKPEDVFQQVKRGGFYGWPFYFQFKGRIFSDNEFKDSTRAEWIKSPAIATSAFQAHSAPLGFEYFKDFNDPELQNSILVCLHGSTSVWRQRGNSVVKVGKGNKNIEIITGFLTGKTEAERHGRPCDILMKDKNSFFFTDDHNGVLYYVWNQTPN